MLLSNLIHHSVVTLSILSTAIIYGTDMFFAIVGKKAAVKSNDNALLDVLGHIHEIADKRMPIAGIVAILSTLLLAFDEGVANVAGQFYLIALLGLLCELALYIRVAKPVNNEMVYAVKYSKVTNDIRKLQNRWDSVIGYRAFAMFVALLFLVSAATT